MTERELAYFFFSSRRRHTRLQGDWSSDVCSSDLSIFDAKTALQLVDDHRATPVHTARFGGGLPARPASEKPPQEVAATESRYVTQLLGAYGEHTGSIVTHPSALSVPKLKDHFRRQREALDRKSVV